MLRYWTAMVLDAGSNEIYVNHIYQPRNDLFGLFLRIVSE